MSGSRRMEDEMSEKQAPGTEADDHDGSTNGAGGGPADETFGWTASDERTAGGSDPRATAERMLGQLQSMIDSLATQAAPVVRQVGAKAAELAAIAAERAGPLAHKAADATADAGGKLATKSRTWAAELRSRAEGGDAAEAAAEATAGDEPAEGSRG